MKIKKAVIPAAGLGTRFLPATKAQPKEMLPIVDKPSIQFIIEEAVESGIEEILIVTGRNKRSIEDHFDKNYELEAALKAKGDTERLRLIEDITNMVNIHYVRQKEPKGLGHAIYCARSFVGNEPFAVLLGDDIVANSVPCLKQLVEVYEQVRTSVLGVQPVPENMVDQYGVIKGEEIESGLYRVTGLVEKPAVAEAPSNVAILGRYIITPEIFEILASTKPGKGGEIQLTDALVTLLARQQIYAYAFAGRRYDVGSKLGFLKATVEFALEMPELRQEFAHYLTEVVKQFQDEKEDLS
ncbi:MAG: UTP--glucose-1-phosphate uridylyltransferase GalU [Candidatus Wallacebacter cryptica]|nr:UTP--glucose-1-phosphate uridylyltransferase GalU [Bacillota bacterium]